MSNEKLIDAEITRLMQDVKRDSFVEGADVNDADVLALILSKFLKWDGVAIAEVAIEALRDANFRELANDFEGALEKEVATYE